MKGIATFGELLLRLAPIMPQQWLVKNQMNVYVGGAELNVAAALSNWDIPTTFISALPKNDIAQEIIDYLKSKKINTEFIVTKEGRIGTYILPKGLDLKQGAVIYDRDNSAFQVLQISDFNLEKLWSEVGWLHISAISPALKEQTAALTLELVQSAHQHKVTVSIDLNYRAKLWQYAQKPSTIIEKLIPYCSVVMGNIWSNSILLNLEEPMPSNQNTSVDWCKQASDNQIKELQTLYPNVQYWAHTFRLKSNPIKYFATLYTADQVTTSNVYEVQHVLDQVGSGDCFMAGLIYAIHHQFCTQDIVNYAASAAIGKLQEQGDFTHQSILEIKARYAHHTTG